MVNIAKLLMNFILYFISIRNKIMNKSILIFLIPFAITFNGMGKQPADNTLTETSEYNNIEVIYQIGRKEFTGRKEYIKRLEELMEDPHFSKMFSQIESNRIYSALSYTSDADFTRFMELNIAELMALTKKHGRPEESSIAKRGFYKLAETGNFFRKFNLFIKSALDNVRAITENVPNNNSDYSKCAKITETRQVMLRLEIFLKSFATYGFPFKKTFKEFGFTPTDSKMVEDYFLKYGDTECKI